MQADTTDRHGYRFDELDTPQTEAITDRSCPACGRATSSALVACSLCIQQLPSELARDAQFYFSRDAINQGLNTDIRAQAMLYQDRVVQFIRARNADVIKEPFTPRLCSCGKPATITVNAPLKPTAPDGESFNIEVCANCFDALWTHNAIIRATNEAPPDQAGDGL